MQNVFAALFLALGLAGCAMVMPMTQLQNVPISYQGDVAQPIERALRARNWVVTARRPGEIDAALIGAEYRLNITVAYTPNSYTVIYRDSEGLDYDGQGNIHRHYNNWMENLRISIERELIAAPDVQASALAPQPPQAQPEASAPN